MEKRKKYLNAEGGLSQSYLSESGGHSTFMNSGGSSAVVSAGAAGGTALATAGTVAWIPVVGQVVAVVAAIVSLGQVFDTMEKQKQQTLMIKNLKQLQGSYQQELDIIFWEGDQALKLIKEEIAYREAAAQTDKLLVYGTFGLLAVSSMVFVYGIKKLNK